MDNSISIESFKSGVANLMTALLRIREKNVVTVTNTVTCDKEMGKWVVRLNGVTIDEYFRHSAAERLVQRIQAGLDNRA